MKRRNFINSMVLLSGGILIPGKKVAGVSDNTLEGLAKDFPDEETFWKTVREQFIFPEDYAYLNTGGIGAVPTLVLNKVSQSMNELEIYPKPGHNHTKWIEIKEKCTELLGSDIKHEELALISTATEGINIVINGLPLGKGDEVITSTHEHPALHIPLLNKMQRHGIVIKSFVPDLNSGSGNVEKIKNLITKRTKLVFISHITCTTGQCFPLQEIGELTRDKNIWFAVDGAQAVGSKTMEIKKWNVDFYTFSGHKWTLGPKRTGVLFVREELLDILRPTTVGAYSDDGYDILKQELKLHPTAQRYEYATQNEALFWGMGKGVDFVKTIGLKKIWEHNRMLAEQFYSGLKNINDVQILSPEEEKYRTSMISFKIIGINYREVASYLSEKRIRVRVVPEANLEGIRVSFHVYNNEEEVERILKGIKAQV